MLLCIKSREYEIANTKFLSYFPLVYIFSKNKGKILKSARFATVPDIYVKLFLKDLLCMFEKLTIFLKQSFPKNLIIVKLLHVDYASRNLSMNFWSLTAVLAHLILSIEHRFN